MSEFLNFRILAAWPNWLIVPVILLFWVFIGSLGTQLLTDPGSNKGTPSQ